MVFDNPMVLTAKGINLYNKVQAGAPLKFTKLKIGSGKLADGDNPETFTALKEYQYDVAISSISNNTRLQKTIISGTINNSNIIVGKYICELGLFANDPDEGEILYSYANAREKGDYIAPANSGAFAWNYQIYAAVGNAANVTAVISNTTFDYAVASSSSAFTVVHGTNQKEINESIDACLAEVKKTSDTINAYFQDMMKITISDSEPSSPKANDIWCKTA